MKYRSHCNRIAIGVLALLIAGVAAAGPGHEHENRNYDARIDFNKGLLVQKSLQHQAAIDELRTKMIDLGVTFDDAMGTTRTLYNQTGYLTGAYKALGSDPMAAAMDYVSGNLAALGLSAEDIADYEVTDSVYSQVSGATHIYLRQLYQGIPVYNGQLHINVNRDGRILSVNNAFVPGLAVALKSATPTLSADRAVAAAGLHLGIELKAVPQVIEKLGGVQEVTRVAAKGFSLEDVEARLMWLPIRAGEVRLVWNFQLQTTDYDHWFDMTVDAETGDVWTRFDWVNSGDYRVYAEPDESPLHGSTGRTLVTDPEDATASPNGWFTGGTMSGNNVTACPDTSPANNSCDSNPQCSGTTCDFPINLNQQPSSFVPAATANLFYWNNLIHDIQYQYGFDEAGGNFQENNFGRGGNGSDSVNADAQDGSGNCNANFATPTDGGNPRMQMFTCNQASPSRDGDLDNGVIVHEYGHGISIRQVGGPGNSSCLNNTQQAGEGWSDLLGLIYTHEPGDAGTDSRGIGTYLFGQAPTGPGIRDLPYSTNPAVNNWTYESISGASIPHGVGSRWAQAAWEVYWVLVDEYGFEPDLHNFDINDPNEAGNKRAMFYINEGLKNTACSPTFVNNRDGIIQAATDSFGGADVCRIWEAFAAFGLGTNASSGGSNSTNPTNGFAIPQICAEPPPDCTNELSGQDFESGAGGWTNGADTCTTGAFIVGTPDSTAWQVGGGNPGQAYFTANNAGGIGTDDVDGGTCEALSPVVNGGGNDVTVILDYYHGQRDAGDDAGDGFTIEVLNNGSVVETIASVGDVTSSAFWTTGFATVPNAGNVQVRVRATDAPAGGDIVEAGIDNVQFCGTGGGGGCTSDAQCSDGLFCNGAETCNLGTGVCEAGAPVVCGDGVSCTIDSCNESTDSCDNVPTDSLCDNGLFCDGSETCDAVNDCQAGTAVQCGDGVSCTNDSCNESTDSCDNTPDDSLCDNGLFCDGSETCDAVNDCQAGTNPCSGSQTCNESTNTCESTGGCLLENDFESGAGGWTGNTGSCTTGDFVIGTPDSTAWQLGSGNPGQAFFTANNPGGIGTDDVDGGTCIALSPSVNASGEAAVSVSLDYYHGQRDAGDDSGDGFTIEVLNNGSVVDTLVSIGDVTNNPGWATASTTVSSPGNIQLRVSASDAAGAGDIVEAGIDNVQICPTTPPSCVVDDDFEAGAPAWNNDPASTCTTGAYIVGNPTEQVNGGVTTQVGGANSGTSAIFSATNTTAGNADIDGGNCILTSPTWSVTQASTLSVAYFHGQRDAGDDAADFFLLEYSLDGGSTWNTLASNGDSTLNAAWTNATAQIPAGSTVQIRMQASDGAGPGDLIEAGIDDVSICAN
ncbi:MAG: M36 family metallopeptidase [Acidobacteriota bacterium]